MEEKKITKPVTMLRMEFAQALADLINNSGLRAFIIEPIVNDCLMELRMASERELQEDMKRYEEEVAKESAESKDSK